MKLRTARGNNLAEFPVAIFLFLFIIVFPLVDLATIYMNANAVYSAARIAAVQGAKAPTFTQAETAAKNVASAASTKFVNIPADNVTVVVYQTPLDPDYTPDPDDPNAKPAPEPAHVITDRSKLDVDPKTYLYQLQVTVRGSVNGLLMLNGSFFGDVPGLTTPLPVATTTSATFENPLGLTN